MLRTLDCSEPGRPPPAAVTSLFGERREALSLSVCPFSSSCFSRGILPAHLEPNKPRHPRAGIGSESGRNRVGIGSESGRIRVEGTFLGPFRVEIGLEPEWASKLTGFVPKLDPTSARKSPSFCVCCPFYTQKLLNPDSILSRSLPVENRELNGIACAIALRSPHNSLLHKQNCKLCQLHALDLHQKTPPHACLNSRSDTVLAPSLRALAGTSQLRDGLLVEAMRPQRQGR